MFFTYWSDLGTTPARVNRYTGEIQINQRYFDNMPELQQKFIIEHEKGHFNLDTRSEFEADKYAFKHIAGSAPRSLKQSVKSISRVLTFRNPEHMHRLTEVVKMALDYDYKHNGNEKAKTALHELNQMLQNNHLNNFHMYNSKDNPYFEPRFGTSDNDDLFDNAKGKAKRQANKAKRQANKAVRVEKRQTRKANRKIPLPPQILAIRGISNAIKRKKALRGVNLNLPADPYTETVFPEDENTFTTYPAPEPRSLSEVEGSAVEVSEVVEESDGSEIEEEQPEFFDEDGNNIDPGYYEESYDNAAGKARREARRALRDEKKKAKVDVIKSRADAKRTKADSKLELAKQGKSGSDWLGSAVSSIAGIFGGNKSAEATDPSLTSGIDPATGLPYVVEPPKILGMPKGVAIAVIAVLVISIIGVVIYLVKRKK